MTQAELKRTDWRLIKHPPAPGAWNMAVDEAILAAIGRGEARPTLRLYAWQPASVSLGYAQPSGDVDQKRLAERGWDLVRRTTGGRAILHTDEVTYAVIGPKDDPVLSGSVLESYRRLSGALLSGLQSLTLPAEALPQADTPGNNTKRKEPVCFEIPSNYEITVLGKKLIGSAQARKQAGILQHGTLPLTGDISRLTQVLTYPGESQRKDAARRLQERATTIENILERPVSWETAAQALVSAFEATLNLNLIPSELSPAEIKHAAELVKQKYAHPSWTART